MHDPFYDLVPRPSESPWEPGRLALLTIDMQYLDAHPAGWMGKLARHRGMPQHLEERFTAIAGIIPSIRRLQDAFRALGEEVIHARVAYRTDDGRDAGTAYMPAPHVQPIARDAKDYELLPEVAAQGDEMVFSKTSASVFNSTAIENVLHRMGIRCLLLTGIVTDGCVELSARDASDRGFAVTLIEDACAASTKEAHADALERMTDGGFIKARSTDDAIARLEQAHDQFPSR